MRQTGPKRCELHGCREGLGHRRAPDHTARAVDLSPAPGVLIDRQGAVQTRARGGDGREQLPTEYRFGERHAIRSGRARVEGGLADAAEPPPPPTPPDPGLQRLPARPAPAAAVRPPRRDTAEAE